MVNYFSLSKFLKFVYVPMSKTILNWSSGWKPKWTKSLKQISVTGRSWNIKHHLCSIVLATIIWVHIIGDGSSWSQFVIKVSSYPLVYLSGSFWFWERIYISGLVRAAILGWKRRNFYGIPLTLVINFLYSKQVIILSEKGGLFGNCLCFNDSWSITFSGQVDFC